MSDATPLASAPGGLEIDGAGSVQTSIGLGVFVDAVREQAPCRSEASANDASETAEIRLIR